MKRFILYIVLAAFLTACGSPQSACAATSAQSISFLLSQVRNASGPLSGGKVYFYAAGTTTPKTVWVDRGKATPAANPYTLDSLGTAQLYGDGVYHIVIKTSTLVTVYDRDYIAIKDASSLAYDVADYASLAAACAALNGTGASLQYSTDQTLTDNLTTGVTLVPVNGAIITVTAGKTLTYQGPTAHWPVAQMFAAGSVVKLGRACAVRYPQWWGAVADNLDTSAAANTVAFNRAVQSNDDPVNHDIKVVAPPGTYYIVAQGTVPYNDGIWDDSASAQPEPVGVAIPQNVTLEGYGAVLRAKATDFPNYAILASFKSKNVHIKGFRLIGERTEHIGTTGEWGHGVFFRDVLKCSIEDVSSVDMWGDGFVIGAMAGGSGSQDVTVTNCFSDNNRRQGMSITGGKKISVIGGRYSNANGTTPKAGIDIETNLSAFSEDIRIIGVHFEGNQYTVQAFKVDGLVVDGCTFRNNIFNFPDFRDRVYNATVSNCTSVAGAMTTHGVAWEDTLDLRNITVSDNTINGGTTAGVLFILSEGATPWHNVVWRNNKFIFSSEAISNLTRSSSPNTTLRDNEFILPPDLAAGDLAALGVIGGRAVVANIASPSYGNEFRNSSSTLPQADVMFQFGAGSYANRGNIAEGVFLNHESPSFLNGWGNVASRQPFTFYRAGDGRTHLAGVIGSGATTFDTQITSVPVQFAPLSTVTVSVVGLSGTTPTPMTLQIKSDGGIYAGRGVVNTEVPLDGISWIPGY